MKRAVLILLLIGLVAVSASGQQQKDLYTKSAVILKIYTHQLGYKVFYLKEDAEVASFFAPSEWFYGASGRGTIVWGQQYDYPYLTVYWENGEFKYLKLFLRRNMQHETWGVLRADVSAVKDAFDVEEPDIEF
jgi:hypothetical protein